jgi:hypothetical protein
MSDIRKMLEKLDIPALKFQGSYFGENGRLIELSNLPKRECPILLDRAASPYHRPVDDA